MKLRQGRSAGKSFRFHICTQVWQPRRGRRSFPLVQCVSLTHNQQRAISCSLFLSLTPTTAPQSMPRFLPMQATPARGSTRQQARQQQRGEEEQQQEREQQQQEAQQQQVEEQQQQEAQQHEAEQRQREQLFEGVWAGKKF